MQMQTQELDDKSKRHIGQIRRILQRCASIAGAHSAQAAVDIRRAFRVEPEFGPRRIYIAGAATPHVVGDVINRGEVPVVPLTEPYIPGNKADYVARYCVPLLLTCDGVAMAKGWEKDRRAVIEHDTAERYQIPISYEKR